MKSASLVQWKKKLRCCVTKSKTVKLSVSAVAKSDTGQLNGTEVALLKSGIGKVAAALGATLLLDTASQM